MSELKVFVCEKCGKVHVELKGSPCPTVCCGEDMKELVANTTDAAQEKHVPVVTRESDKVVVTIGSVEHPMTEEHFIEFVILETESGFRVAELHPGDTPRVEFLSAEGVKAVYAYCNLHGLWKTEA